MRQEGIVGNQMYLEIFALSFYVSDIVTFNTNEAMVTFEISYIAFTCC